MPDEEKKTKPEQEQEQDEPKRTEPSQPQADSSDDPPQVPPGGTE